MTNVFLGHKNRKYTVHCKGHATGSTEICAAVSCLVQTLAVWLEQSSATVLEMYLGEDAEVKLVFSGYGAAKAVFDLMCVGFGCLEKTDPERIHVEIENF